MSTAIVVTSGKGGTGKTSVTGGVASCLAAMGYRVLCIDMDIGLRNLDLSLGMSDRALMDFTDVVEGRCSLERAVVEHPDFHNLFLLTAPLRASCSYPDSSFKLSVLVIYLWTSLPPNSIPGPETARPLSHISWFPQNTSKQCLLQSR